MPPSRLARALLAALLLALPAAAASPASDLFDSATRQVTREYYGWSISDLKTLSEKYDALLRVRCSDQGDACSYDTGREVLTDLFKEFGDAHTNVRDPEGAERLREVTQDMAVERTGARLARVEGGLLVVTVMPGSPAEADGLRVFDLVTTVNGEAAGKRGGENAPIGPNEFVRLERAGKPISVTVKRPASPELSLSLGTRQLLARDVPTLSWAGADGKVAVIAYPTFLPRDASELFLARLKEAQAAGARELIVDLRYNGGGSLTECVAAASVFAPVEYKSQTRYNGRLSSYSFTGVNGTRGNFLNMKTIPPGSAVWKGPTAILVGPGTASCAEVFTYYAQRAGAIAVGEKTRGVGNSGVMFDPLPDGGVVSVTVLRAFNEKGEPLPDSITPDVLAPGDIAALTGQGRDVTLEAALRALEMRAASR
ncbi:S41 family peptidase [Deinococcus arenicola]|uniref:S41 family peptidase n=1 Tax=Deinococcus arenicola TaxID=2994950 RepID=A0ABU4DRA7_9DEIO|nr:S41 family peptidase [Deinococcus sp. ZS9-10]MDV6374964.1 S41 family peptidase [Deinococcus sp. ZS9-10]